MDLKLMFKTGLYLLIYFFSLVQVSFSQDSSTKIEELEKDIKRLNERNIELSAKITAYKENASDILNTVSISLGSLVVLYAVLYGGQYMVNRKQIKNKLKELEIELDKELDIRLSNTIKNVDLYSDIKLKKLQRQINNLDIMLHQNRFPELSNSDSNIELFDFATLLNKSKSYYKDTGESRHIEFALDGIIKHLKKYPLYDDFQRESVFNALKDIDGIFELKIIDIKKLLIDKL